MKVTERQLLSGLTGNLTGVLNPVTSAVEGAVNGATGVVGGVTGAAGGLLGGVLKEREVMPIPVTLSSVPKVDAGIVFRSKNVNSSLD